MYLHFTPVVLADLASLIPCIYSMVITVLTGIFQSPQSLKSFWSSAKLAQFLGPVVNLGSERSHFKALSEQRP